MMTELTLPERKNRIEGLRVFAEQLTTISERVGFRVSARGWCYILEQPPYSLITKAQFDLVENAINKCRRKGILPIDFTSDEEGRKFSGVETPNTNTPIEDMREWLDGALKAEEYYTPNWWDGEEYYIQMVVEKIDLKTLFEPVCREYHIPIATAKGWSSMLMRAIYAKRFKRAESRGLKCVLLYCGDHDPDGLRISDFIMKNLRDLKDINWKSGEEGYDPSDLIIDRFGLNYDFIIKNKLSWIENLITGSGKNLADPSHKNFHMPYVQDYLKKIGERKCEATSLVTNPTAGRELCKETIERYLGRGAVERFKKKRQRIRNILRDFRKRTGLDISIQKAIKIIDKEGEKE